ncbi:hypothetical protein ACFE04_011707 [Oxalis oulophora]
MSMLVLLLVELVNGLSQSGSDLGALLELKKGFSKDPSGKLLVSWDDKSLPSNGCPPDWFGVICSDDRVVSITLDNLGLVGNFSFSAIAGLSMLRNLSVSNNQFTGSISNIGSLPPIVEFLDISGNMFQGSIPVGITNLKKLVLFNISSNQFDGTVPSGFGNLETLEYLDFQGNAFSGDVMDFIGQLGSVAYVDLSNNCFSGALDLGLGTSKFISSIQYLNVSHNDLGGELFAHDGVPYFDSLEVLDASYNQFVGAIPPFKFVVSLQVLRLGNNQLSGSLPESFFIESSLVLSELDLSANQLEGTLILPTVHS